MVYLQRYLVVTWLVPRKTAAVSAHVLCTPYDHAQVYCVTLLEAVLDTCRVHVRIAVTCHVHFRQSDQDLLRAPAVTRGWSGYRNKFSLSCVYYRKECSLPGTCRSVLHSKR